MPTESAPYHHGSLRRAVIDKAAEVIADVGPEAVSVRRIASDLGVTHTAVSHHVGSRAGLLSAVAAEGFAGLTEALSRTQDAGGTLLDLGVTYVRYGLTHPAHFRVMFRPDVLDDDDPELHTHRDAAMRYLSGGVAESTNDPDREHLVTATSAAWALMHGITELVLSNSLTSSGLLADKDEEAVLALAHRAAGLLQLGPPTS